MTHCECNLETRNRFEPDNRFIGDIEDGKRYPYGVYTKCEADARFLKKSEVPEIPEIEDLKEEIESKADKSELEGLQTALSITNKLNPEFIDYSSEFAKVSNTEKASWNDKLEYAGSGLTKSGTTINHSNAVAAKTVPAFSQITYDTQGHITGSADATAAQLEAINSGATAGKIAAIETIDTKTADLQGQIDQIVISAAEESVVAPEVAAARVGTDGTEYSTLKNRLDAENTAYTQMVSGFTENLEELGNKVISQTPNLYIPGYTERENGYMALPNATTITPSSSYITLKVKVKPNTKYTITHQRHWGGFFDYSGNNVGHMGGNSEDFYDYTVETPANTAYMWVVVPASENLSAFMIVEGTALPADPVMGKLYLQNYINIPQSIPLINMSDSRHITFDITTKSIAIPQCSIVHGTSGKSFAGKTLNLKDTPTDNSSWALLYDYDLNDIVVAKWKGPFSYPVIGMVYYNKIYFNGVLENQIIYMDDGVEISTSVANANAYIQLSDSQKIVYNYDNKTLLIPAPAFTIINNKGVARPNPITLELSSVLVSGACMLWCTTDGEIYATSWNGDKRHNKSDSLLGSIYHRNVVIFGAKEEDIVVKDSTVCFFGDSITAGVHTTKTYHMYFAEWGGFVCKNYGIGGTGYVKTISGDTVTGGGAEGIGTSIAQSGDNTVIDIMRNVDEITKCVIFSGTNDFGSSIDIGAFRTAVQNTLDYALTRTPYILVITPIMRENYKTRINNVGKKLVDYSNVVIEECNNRGIAYVDGMSVSLNPDNASYKSTFIPDGLHPNATGHTMLARKMYSDFLAAMAK